MIGLLNLYLMVNHATKEFARDDVMINTVEEARHEGSLSALQGKHLHHRYLAEFDSRYNARVVLGINDTARTVKALLGARRKRLTYGDSSAWPKSQ